MLKKSIGKFVELRSLACLIGMLLIVGVINPEFLSITSVMNCFNDSVVFTLLSVGIAFVIFTGEIDVSVGMTLGLSAAVSSSLLRDGFSLPVAVIAAVFIGLIVGLVNGYLVAYRHIASLILTLATNGIGRGLIYVYTKGSWVENLPADFTAYSQMKIFSELTTFYLLAVLLVFVLDLLVKKTKRGRQFIAVGDNYNGALLVGIKAARIKLLAYVLCGVFAAVAGVIYSSRIGFITPLAGNAYEMKAIAACVIGGVSLIGGQGSILGAAIGAVIMSSVNRILVFIGLSSNFDNTITGILLISLVVIDALLQKREAFKLKRYKFMLQENKKEGR